VEGLDPRTDTDAIGSVWQEPPKVGGIGRQSPTVWIVLNEMIYQPKVLVFRVPDLRLWMVFSVKLPPLP
jgi:hypothetical protein